MSLILVLMLTSVTHASHVRPTSAAECSEMTTWDYVMGMCMPRAMPGMPMRMVMVNVNAFVAQVHTSRPRGTNALAAPNMFMVDTGRSVGERQYFNLDFMGTLERWTLPKDGYPELLQIGEHNAHGTPFVDSQHPHSSPIMGLTLSDTISYGRDQDHVKLFAAPRGQATEGPVAFMHRPTGMVNPDAPLGHHVGQDVAHIASTVVGAGVRRGSTIVQLSGFHGAEPEPTKVDLPLGPIDSAALRLIHEVNPKVVVMGSAASVLAHDHVYRYSASAYSEHALSRGWILRNTAVWGLVNFLDHAPSLNSFGDEFWFDRGNDAWWGRIEALERTPAQLNVAADAPDRGRYVVQITLGYARDAWQSDGVALSFGAAVTQDLLPAAYRTAYGEYPFGAKVFARLTGMRMWHF